MLKSIINKKAMMLYEIYNKLIDHAIPQFSFVLALLVLPTYFDLIIKNLISFAFALLLFFITRYFKKIDKTKNIDKKKE